MRQKFMLLLFRLQSNYRKKACYTPSNSSRQMFKKIYRESVDRELLWKKGYVLVKVETTLQKDISVGLGFLELWLKCCYTHSSLVSSAIHRKKSYWYSPGRSFYRGSKSCLNSHNVSFVKRPQYKDYEGNMRISTTVLLHVNQLNFQKKWEWDIYNLRLSNTFLNLFDASCATDWVTLLTTAKIKKYADIVGC